jgi:hypothetical protein
MLVLVLTVFCINVWVYAADTKVLTKTQVGQYSGTVTIKENNSKEVVSKIIYRGSGTSRNYYDFVRNLRNTSTNYDDGTFAGTLYYNGQYTRTYRSVSQFGPLYYWEVEVTYKGTVYRK